MSEVIDGKKSTKCKVKSTKPASKNIYANRGRSLEQRISLTNYYYREHDLALIYKRPTPIRVLKVDYTKGARITSACFEKQSTTDFNGVISGRYVDIEAKSTISKTSFPIHNIYEHQIHHLKNVIKQGGLAFFIIEFATFKEIYLVDAGFIISWFEENPRRSIPYRTMMAYGYLIPHTEELPVDYLPIIQENFMNN
jgi:recombination protein U